jgi:hypothetical protein
MNVEPKSGITDPHRQAPITRVYTGSYEDCRKVMERDAAELAPAGYHVVSESYDVSWGAGVCVGCLSVEFARAAPVAHESADASQTTQP